MTRDEIILVKQISREIVKEEIALAIESLRGELKMESENIYKMPSSGKKEVKEDGKTL